ncbi:hypothetical protein C797_04299 [Bacillus thuringiensis Sbt003]|uniref:Replication-relaxation n=1 Tax=Bacillus thuringiensis Sbt003 TaxID=1235825 RepID=A0A9X0FDK4_BACTU|nr:replication-relaxation family protein [Bacillus thuringiensis]KIU76523.1 hypothetical protein C797_04299 [Bacillus thuringiensis Sbt003]
MKHQKMKQKTRHIEILSSLNKLDFASRRQLQAIHCLGSIRNANRILKDLRQYCHVTSHNREYVYYLNKKGMALLGIQAKERKKKHQLEHILFALLRTYTDLKGLTFCLQVITLRYQGEEKTIVPDAFFIKDNVHHFVEVDRLQHMKVNEKKLQLYGNITNIYKKQKGTIPVIIFFTLSDYRQCRLEEYAMKYNVFLRTMVVKEIF